MSAALKAFALSLGQTVRTAQRHKLKNTPEWQRFMGTQLVAAMQKSSGDPRSEVEVEVLGAVSVNAPDADYAPPSDRSQLSEPEQMWKAHWDMWKDTHRRWKQIAGKNSNEDALVASSLGLAATKLREACIKAKRDFEDWQQRQRLVIPNSEVQAARQGFWIPFFNLLRNMPAELSAMCDPAIRAEVRRLADDYLVTRLQPQSTQILDDLDNMTGASS